mmetsp:Transcript_20276/g.56382  ORF Transcript_20276/g.56382 Transcript_20276/m.56382 type:complete len:498 (+) Transcript_20276:134-1627(+)
MRNHPHPKRAGGRTILAACCLWVGIAIASESSSFSSSSSLSSSSSSTTPRMLRHGTTRAGSKQGPCARSSSSPSSSEDLYEQHPSLCAMLDRLEEDAGSVASELEDFARSHNLLVGDDLDFASASASASFALPTATTTATATATASPANTVSAEQLPVVFAHGMGDSCFNSGMIRIGEHTSELLGGGNGNGNADADVYVTCIPTGDTKTEDTTNGYFLNMDKSVDVFAARVAADPKLSGGFHAIGFSQGNNVIRGYVARYNTPTVHTFVSVNGVNAGEGTVPGCFPDASESESEANDNANENANANEHNQHERTVGSFCDLLLEQASRRAYTEFAQEHSFQSNYWRDPRAEKLDDYHRYSQLARWNNEGPHNNNATLNENFARTSLFVWVRATRDSLVWPSEGEHWGCPDASASDPFASPVLPMNETEWYREDLFGLKTAQEAGKNVFETFEGDHLRFTMEDFDRWVLTYLKTANNNNNNNNKNKSKNTVRATCTCS